MNDSGREMRTRNRTKSWPTSLTSRQSELVRTGTRFYYKWTGFEVVMNGILFFFLVDLVYNSALGHLNHDAKIDWLELNETGTKLLFRDRKLRLYLVNVAKMEKTAIMHMCNFVQVGSTVQGLFV